MTDIIIIREPVIERVDVSHQEVERVNISQPIVLGSQTQSQSIRNLTASYTAAENISALRCVSLNAGEGAVYTNPDDLQSIHSIVGISITAALAGQELDIALSGIVHGDTWYWEVGKPVFVTSNGTLTQTIPDTTYIVRIGWAISTKDIDVNINQLVGGV